MSKEKCCITCGKEMNAKELPQAQAMARFCSVPWEEFRWQCKECYNAARSAVKKKFKERRQAAKSRIDRSTK